MSDQPRDGQPSESGVPKPSADQPSGWYDPSEETDLSPEATGEGTWHFPAVEEPSTAGEGERSATVDREAPLPGAWYVPDTPPATATASDYDKSAEEPGGWYVPDAAMAEGILAGVDATIYPPPQPVVEEEPPDVKDEPTAAQVAAEMARKLEEENLAAAAESLVETVYRTEEPEPVAAEVTPPPQATSPLAGLIDQFDSVEKQVHSLRDAYRQGLTSREDLQAELRKLMILDEQGTWWMVGLESDVWYRFVDGQWVESERPRAASAEPQGPAYDVTMDTSPSITLDEDNMPVPHRVPRIDLEATMVGASAVQFDELPSVGATMPSNAVYQSADAELFDAAQPDYEQAYDPAGSDLYRRVQKEQADRTRVWVIRAGLIALFGGLAIGLVLVVGSILFYMGKVGEYDQRVQALSQIAGQFETTRIYDVNGNLLSQINDPTGGTRISVPLEQISPYLIHATISVENERFYEDPGWDPIAIARAVVQNIQEGSVVSGASTITQQLARALVLDPERRTEITVSRKIDEVIIAAEIGRRYSKNEILELYLNEIYYGNLAYGAEAAAQTYFGISARDLNLPQSAFLAGLVGAPATFDPVTNREGAFVRMNATLNFMTQRGCINFQHEPYVSQGPFCVAQQDIAAAVVQRAEVEVREYSMPSNSSRYPHFVNFVAQQLEVNYGLADIYRAGFNVFTTLDPNIQDMAQAAVRDQVAALAAQGRGGNNASVVVLDPRDGRILAMVGSADYNSADIDGQVNVAFTPQQPGSSIKPLVYAAAFQGNPQGQYWTPATIIWDTPTCWGTYCPTNYDSTFHGPQSARSALANSYNVPAVKVLDFVTTDRYAQVAQALGLTFPGNTPQESGLPGALGAFDVRLYDMVSAYGVLANGGKRVAPFAITRITDNQNAEIPLPSRPEPQQVIQPEHTYLVTHILSDDVARSSAFGRNSLLNIPGRTVAVKTGTTNDNRDNWTIGYTPSVVVGVWHGNTDNSPMRNTSGFTGAAPIWNAVMTAVLSTQPPQEFPIPPGVTTVEVCADSGTLPSQNCLNRRQELAVQSQLPPGPENDIYQKVRVDSLTGLVANDFCPNFTEERTFLKLNDGSAFAWINNTQSGQAWAQQRGLTVPVLPLPTDACNANIQQPIISMDWPLANTEVQGVVEVRGRVLVYNFNRYQIEFGIGTNPESFSLVDGPYTVAHVNSEFIGRWDVSQLPNGPYTVRLHVITNDGGFANVDHTVMVNNQLPTPTAFPSPVIITQTPTTIPGFPTQVPGFATATPFPTPLIVTNTVTPVAQASALPPFDINASVPVVYGAVATGFISDQQVASYYRFSGQAGDQVDMAAVATAGGLDTLMYLMDASGQIVAENDDGGTGTDSNLAVGLPASGDYIIVVTRFDVSAGFSTGEFRLTLTKLN